MTTQSPPRQTWLDMTLRVADEADVTIERQPNGDVEYTIPLPESPSSSITFVIPVAVARRINVKVREVLAAAPALAAALITG